MQKFSSAGSNIGKEGRDTSVNQNRIYEYIHIYIWITRGGLIVTGRGSEITNLQTERERVAACNYHDIA